MKHLIHVSVCSTLLWCMSVFTHAAHAQEAPTAESGSTLHIIDSLLASASGQTIATNRSTLTADQREYDDLVADEARLRTRQMDQRRTCRQAIRSANKNTIIAVASQCFRAEVLQEMTIVKREQTYAKAIPLVDENLRARVIEAANDLMDANDAIVDAVDANVFVTMESLINAKQNVHAQYRVPLQLLYTKLRASRQQTWLLYMASQLRAWVATLELADGDEVTLQEVATCLKNANEEIEYIMYSNNVQTAYSWHNKAKKTISTCRNLLEGASSISGMSSGNSSSSEGA